MMKTYSLKPKDVTRQWYIMDASETPLGRLATTAASLLIGKSKPAFTPHVDAGDFVVIINSDKLVITGNKEKEKIYYRHSGFPGGLRQRSLRDAKKLDSRKVIGHAVAGMLPNNKLRAQRLKRLKIYPSNVHPHQPQNPRRLALKSESEGKK